uniref:Uncharacterized protein n=1 Tax=Aegilops tauschii subsp. strangulata TaxID=200361 RepID=A0A453SZL4_AEGTS
MSPQTETKAGVGFQAGVKDYKLTYYTLLFDPFCLSRLVGAFGAIWIKESKYLSGKPPPRSNLFKPAPRARSAARRARERSGLW